MLDKLQANNTNLLAILKVINVLSHKKVIFINALGQYEDLVAIVPIDYKLKLHIPTDILISMCLIPLIILFIFKLLKTGTSSYVRSSYIKKTKDNRESDSHFQLNGNLIQLFYLLLFEFFGCNTSEHEIHYNTLESIDKSDEYIFINVLLINRHTKNIRRRVIELSDIVQCLEDLKIDNKHICIIQKNLENHYRKFQNRSEYAKIARIAKSKSSPYVKKFAGILGKMHESGLDSKCRDAYATKIHKSKYTSKYTVEYEVNFLIHLYVLLSFGYSLSTIVFCIEYIIGQNQ
ncbi:hypothetical protein TSAR_011960 [Trichomalopsis sarcophagae]|uniref:Uncharacterized protein n=1 Tax=Trichomalopsis sarcophagae TaxID=543379 RepID=A0A232EL07_9HYME|nr:hypothetical protein TSAR_011960 [Trichomalopsis sarcophagae]